MKAKKRTLSELRPGDHVIVEDVHRNKRELTEVVRQTDTQLVVKGYTSKFRKADGHEVGGTSWSTLKAIVPTRSEVRNMQEASQRSKNLAILRTVDWKRLSNHKLQEVVDLLMKGE